MAGGAGHPPWCFGVLRGGRQGYPAPSHLLPWTYPRALLSQLSPQPGDTVCALQEQCRIREHPTPPCSPTGLPGTFWLHLSGLLQVLPPSPLKKQGQGPLTPALMSLHGSPQASPHNVKTSQ